MKKFEETYEIHAPIETVWQAFVDSKVIDKWGGGPASMSDKEGAKFKLWGGDIHGTNTKIVKGELLEQDWYGGKGWEEASKVSFSLKPKGDKTVVHLTHEKIPDYSFEDIKRGWGDYYLGPLKELLE